MQLSALVSTRHAAPHVYSNHKDILLIDDLTGTEWVICACAVGLLRIYARRTLASAQCLSHTLL